MALPRKRGYFFILDAFIAITIFIICTVLILSYHSSPPNPTPSIMISDDLMHLLSTTKVYELNNPYVKELIATQQITKPDNTLLEQIIIFNITGNNSKADFLAANITSNLAPPRYGLLLRIYNATNEYSSQINNIDTAINDSRLISSSKIIIYGMMNSTQAFGPYTAEVILWQ